MNDDEMNMILAALKSFEASLDAKVDTLRSDLMASLDRNEDLLTSIRDDIAAIIQRPQLNP